MLTGVAVTGTKQTTAALDPSVRRYHIRVKGLVQGVGFRPFVYNLAHSLGLSGWVRNDTRGVLIEVQGPQLVVESFASALSVQAPPLARVEQVVVDACALRDEAPGFEILHSDHAGKPTTVVPSDSHVCEDCLREFRDPADRRYRYPFINCTNCGPRYSLIRGLPYDRAQTTMAAFTMCAQCRWEYEDPADRRYHAQPNACPACGPRLVLAGPDGLHAEGEEANSMALKGLLDGAIVAVKSVGGFHLAVNARDESAVARLRHRKKRDAKPFALMVSTVEAAEQFAFVHPAEAELLRSPARPIVLLRKRPSSLPEPIAPRNPSLGIMLASTPLHYLLLDEELDVLVMTSGNVSGYPIVHRNEDALGQLFAVADLILYHDRDIETRVDDSVVRVTLHPELGEPLVTFVRRSKGYAPSPIRVAHELHPLVGYGAELKTTVALTNGDQVYLSQHIGDLKNDSAFESHRRTVQHLVRLHDLAPTMVACDLHPAFRATRSALSGGDAVELVQHHHAHMASCMAENHLSGQTLGVIFDGAGYGEDETIWGGEFLLGDYLRADRVAHLRPIRLLGGDRAVHEPIRTGFALALDALGGVHSADSAFPVLRSLDEDHRQVFATMARRGLNAPLTSSIGRLFDGVAALLDICTYAEYEANGPIELEGLLGRDLTTTTPYPFSYLQGDGLIQIDQRPLIKRIAADLAAAVDIEQISRRFHSTVVAMVVDQCRSVSADRGVNQVVLSGGVFLNEFLLTNCLLGLRAAGLDAHCHRQVPTNDGGIALGQVMVADARIRARDRE